MVRMRHGSPEMFWKMACWVNLVSDIEQEQTGWAYVLDDQWVGYELSHLHGTDAYYLTVDEVMPYFDAVVAKLEAAAQRREETIAISGRDTMAINGYLKWRDGEAPLRNIDALLREMQTARQEYWIPENPEMIGGDAIWEREFHERWRQVKWYWANIVFEWAFLTGLALFAVWPGLRGGSILRWAVHAASLPILFLLPVYLGYATLTFTSVGPSGGILYPWLVMFVRGGRLMFFDRWLLEHIPQVLEPLSISTGSAMAITGMGLPGPTTALIAGLILSGIVLGGRQVLRWW